MLSASQFFENLPYLYLRCSASGVIEYFNCYASRMSESNEEGLLTKNIIANFHPDDRAEVSAVLNIETGKPNTQHTHRWKKNNESYFWCKWQWTRCDVSADIYIMGEDVSQQKRVESAFLALEEVTDTGYWEIDLDTRVLFWSQKVHEIHETDSRQYTPSIDDALQFYHEDSIAPLTEALTVLEQTGEPYDIDLKFKSYLGNDLIVNVHGFSEESKGRVVRNFGTFKDLTNIKRAERDRKDLEQRVLLTLEAAKIGVWEYDFASDHLVWDERLIEMFGKINEPLTNTLADWQGAIHPDDLRAAEQAFQESIDNKTYFNHTFRVLTKTGEVKHLLGMASTIYDENGTPIRATGVNVDLSESEKTKQALKVAKNQAQANATLAQVMAEKAKAADQQKGAFLANMSHEIRTPISGIMGLIDMLHDLNEDSKAQNSAQVERYLGLAKNTSIHLLKIIGDILDFSKIEAGKIAINNVSFTLESVLQDLISGYTLQTREKGLYIDYETQAIELQAVMGDELRLKQILYNLLSNALKFTKVGGLTVRAKLIKEDDQNAKFICSVADTGCGIDEKDMVKLFSPFEQFDTSSTKSSQGTGLGLSISRELARLMGGEINVSSQKGKGSQFVLKLPFKLTTMTKLPYEVDRESALQSQVKDKLAKFHLLVVEDNEINQIIVTNMLAQLGVSYTVAANGQEALDQLRSTVGQKFDLILMDCQMPIMDGYEATKLMRSEPAFAHYATTPVVALTANAMAGDKEKCLQAGMDDYMAKPLQKNLLVDKLLTLVV